MKVSLLLLAVALALSGCRTFYAGAGAEIHRLPTYIVPKTEHSAPLPPPKLEAPPQPVNPQGASESKPQPTFKMFTRKPGDKIA
jgi:hypothetical protein